jgi:hypothetical protein
MARSAAKVGQVGQQALGRLGGGGSGQAADAATEQVGQVAAKATEQLGEAAVEASGRRVGRRARKKGLGGSAVWPRAVRGGEPKRGTRRSRSSGGDGK